MSIPWETIIKEYRRELGTKTFPKLRDYMDGFCEFLPEIARYVSNGYQGDGQSETSGIAIAGFGEKEIFPALAQVRVHGIKNGFLSRDEIEADVLTPQENALLVPFAQRDMVYQFMEGIDPTYDRYISEALPQYLDGYSDTLLDILGDQISVSLDSLRAALKEDRDDVTEQFIRDFNGFRNLFSASPILQMVSILPKEQLAEMAESLVSLTSLKRRVSLEEETVGGPIDVAVITKGDGMIWIKRKHYFSPELNRSFFQRT